VANYWLYVNSGKLIVAAMYLRRARVVGRSFAAAWAQVSAQHLGGNYVFSTENRKRTGEGLAGTTTTTTRNTIYFCF
jgi:hypothetical protein